MQVKKKGVPLQSLSETGVRQEPQGGRKNKFIDTSDKIFWMDAKKAIEEGRSYLLVMTDRRMKPDEADAKKMQKIEKFIEKTERKKLPSPK